MHIKLKIYNNFINPWHKIQKFSKFSTNMKEDLLHVFPYLLSFRIRVTKLIQYDFNLKTKIAFFAHKIISKCRLLRFCSYLLWKGSKTIFSFRYGNFCTRVVRRGFHSTKGRINIIKNYFYFSRTVLLRYSAIKLPLYL